MALKRLRLHGIGSAAAMAGTGLFLATILAQHPAHAAPRITDTFCKTIMDRAAEIWPLDQVKACAPWRAKHQADLYKTAAACRTKDPLSSACDRLDDAAQRFWMESEYVENNRDTPADRANSVLKSPPVAKPAEESPQ